MGDQQEIHFFDDEKIFSGQVDYENLHGHYGPVPEGTLAGDCTPSYLYWEPAARRIFDYNPAIKFLVLLRNPVERAFAHWNMQRFKQREPLDFLEALKEEKTRLARPLSIESRRFSYVDRGFYSRQLDRFFGLFPRDQFKIVKAEDFREHQKETLDSIFRFLGLEQLKSISGKDRNIVPYEREMRPDEREYLRRIFADEILCLEKLLSWDCSDWKS